MTIPKSIDGYPVVKEIGSGASGVVYQVKLPGRQRYAALKLFTGELDQVEILRFKREFGAIARCRHQGIVSVYGLGEHQQRPYILMEFIKGQPFDAYIRDGLRDMEPLPVDRADKLIDSVLKVLETLKYLHGRRIVHRDIKPGNMVVTDNGEIKLLDFGMAWQAVSTDYDDAGGTAGYQAPEMLLHGKVDPRADLYSLGICVYQIITGFHPFGTFTTWQDLIEKQTRSKYNSIRVMNPGFDESWEFFTSRLMAPDPSNRYLSAIQASVDLHRLADLTHSGSGVDEDHGWGLLDATWIGDESLFPSVEATLNDGNVLLECRSGRGRTRFLQEFEKRYGNVFRFVTVDFKQDPIETWVKRLVSIFPDTDNLTADLRAARETIDAFLDKSHQVEEKSPEQFRDRFLEAVEVLITHLEIENAVLLLDNLDAANGLNLKTVTRILSSGYRAIATGNLDLCKEIANFHVETIEQPDSGQAERLIRERLGLESPLPQPVIERLLELSENRLGRISQFLDAWYLSGDLYFADAWHLKPPASLSKISILAPEAGSQIVKTPDRRRRLPTMERLDREVLRLVSVCRGACSFELISGIFAAREALLLEVIDRLIRTNWLEEVYRSDCILYRFRDAQDKAHVYQTMSPFHIKYLHRRSAEILVRLDSEDRDSLAEHLSLSDNALAGIDLIETAACAARDRFDNHRALELYQRLIDTVGRAVKDSSELIGGPEDWVYSFAGLSQSILNESAKNARRYQLGTLQKQRLEAFRDRGNIFGRTGDYGAAFDSFQHMLSESRDRKFRQLEGEALRLIGQILFYQRKLDESERYFRESLEVREAEGDEAGIADCLNGLGVLAQQSNRLDEAMSWFQRSLGIKTRLNDERGMVYIQNNIANIYYNQGKLKEALEEFKASSKVFRQLNDSLGLAYCLYNIGGVAIELDLFDEAVDVLEESLAIRRKMQDLQDTGHCLWQLASALIGAGKKQSAASRLTEAIEILEKIGLNDDADACREMLASLK